MHKKRIATDVGGTFTDLVYLEEISKNNTVIRVVKANTTSPFYEEGIMEALKKTGQSLDGIDEIIHGTTAVINALTERKGVKTGLITTEGFRDILEIGRCDRPDFFNMSYKKQEPFVARYYRREVSGRISYQGDELEVLNLSQLDEILQDFRAENVEAIAICLLNSYANPLHEVAVKEYVTHKWPEVAVIASSQITREMREYERSNTAVLSAYIKPIVQKYVTNLTKHLNHISFNGDFYLMQSNGGMDISEHIIESPLTLLESGPASGMYGAAELGKILGEYQCVGLDVGGTTAKCSLIINGQVQTKTNYNIECSETTSGYPILLPVVDIVEIGSGGGSLVTVDKFKQIHVGPKSAGARPGPIAYGAGGTQLTTTDANLMLGYINPNKLCGGSRSANMKVVAEAFRKLAATLDKAPQDLARDIVRLANHSMLNALKLISVNRGKDPRDFALIPFGGGGGLHAGFLALELQIKKIVLPQHAAAFSALGMLLSDVRQEFIQTRFIDFSQATSGVEILKSLSDLKQRANNNSATATIKSYGRLRYQNQEHYLELEISDRLDSNEVISHLSNDFHNKYQVEYTYKLDSVIELVGFRIVVAANMPKITLPKLSKSSFSFSEAFVGYREVDYLEFGIHKMTSIFDGDRLSPGDRIDGPAIIERIADVCVILPNTQAAIDDYGNIVISLDKLLFTQIPAQMFCDQMSLRIVQKIFETTTKEMFTTFARAAMGTVIYEIMDMGTGLTDKEGSLITSGSGVPVFSGLLDKTVRNIIQRHKNIVEGDIFIVNSPYAGGVTHLNDVALAMPIFVDNKIVAWSANIAHWSDIGGLCPGSMSPEAKDIFHEGIQIPPIKLYSKGELIDSIIELLMANSRMPEVLKGDLLAGVASVRVAENRIKACIWKYGHEAFEKSITDYFDLGQRITLDSLIALPKGLFTSEEEQDDGTRYHVSIEITDKKFTVDLRNNCNQSPGPFNLSRDAVLVIAQMILKTITSPSTVCNAGTYRVLEVLTRKGSIFDPCYPAAMGMYYELAIRLHDLLLRALAPSMPYILSSGGYASICGTFFGGIHPGTGNPVTVLEVEPGGWGASHDSDGASGLFSGLNGETYLCPAEVSEARNGIFVKHMSYHNQEGGEGQFRGGKGLRIDYQIRSDKAWLTAVYSRSRILPWALEGGREGSANFIEIVRATGEVERHAIVTAAELKQGDIIRVMTGTGAGWGNPLLREETAIAEDLKNGYITDEQAKKFYDYPRNPQGFWGNKETPIRVDNSLKSEGFKYE